MDNNTALFIFLLIALVVFKGNSLRDTDDEEDGVYFLQRLKIICGQYEFYSISVHSAELETPIEELAETNAEQFYDGSPVKQGNCFYFFGGEVAVKVDEVKPLTYLEYKLMNKCL